jgi:proteasome lid subunit RPN8/RPN11
MSLISLSMNHLQTIKNHAEKMYHNECCGLLLGNFTPEGKIVVEVWPTDNAWTKEVENYWPDDDNLTEKTRYAIGPQDMLKAMKRGRDQDLEIIGIYHSHPDYPATPSEFDRIGAWRAYSYIIVSVEQGRATQVLSWVLDTNHQFQSEKIREIDPNRTKIF